MNVTAGKVLPATLDHLYEAMEYIAYPFLAARMVLPVQGRRQVERNLTYSGSGI
jgi:hypothetical protein